MLPSLASLILCRPCHCRHHLFLFVVNGARSFLTWVRCTGTRGRSLSACVCSLNGSLRVISVRCFVVLCLCLRVC